MPTKSFSDLSPRGKVAAVIGILIGLVIVGAAQRDLQHRPASQVRGEKLLWRLVSLNAVGALAYLRWGRKGAARSGRPGS